MASKHGLGRTGHVDRSAADTWRLAQSVAVFGLLLLVTGAVVGAMVATGTATALSALGLPGYVGLVLVQLLLVGAVTVLRAAFPLNLLLAGLFAAFEGVFFASVVAAFRDAAAGYVLAKALGITSLVFVGFLAVPLVTGRTFDWLGVVLVPALFCLLGISIARLFAPASGWTAVGIDLVAVVVFSLFVLYDASEILQREVGTVAGALTLYLDFVLIFYHFLRPLLALYEDT